MSKQKKQDDISRRKMSRLSDAYNKQNQSGKKSMSINQRFLLQSLIPVGYFYKTYKGIDLTTRKYVIIYIKPSSKEKLFSKNIKEELREKVAPPLKWSGTEKIDKNLFDIQVHAKYGPSLYEVMINYRKKVSEKTLYLLAYHLLKLIDRIDNAGYVNRSLTLKTIILGESFSKNDLYLLNTFDLQRKNQQSFSLYDIKYCSIGTHLKLKTCSKDTLESMCYALMDFYLKGNLFTAGKGDKEKEFLEEKSKLKPEGVPVGFLEFFQYVRNLNYGEEIKFTEWKIKFKKLVPEEDSKQYQWINSKTKSEDKSQTNSMFASLFQNSRFSSKSNPKYSQFSPQPQPQPQPQPSSSPYAQTSLKPSIRFKSNQNSDDEFEQIQDQEELEQGETQQKMEIREKNLNARFVRL